jgi:hypothetical protein
LKVSQAWPEGVESAGQRPTHPLHPASRPQDEGLDPLGNDLLTPKHGDKAHSVVHPSELPQKVLHMALVPGPAPAKHIGVDDDLGSSRHGHRGGTRVGTGNVSTAERADPWSAPDYLRGRARRPSEPRTVRLWPVAGEPLALPHGGDPDGGGDPANVGQPERPWR